MLKKLKEIIENAKQTKAEDNKKFTCILLVNSGRRYKGTWGGKDWNHIIVVGEEYKTHDYYILNDGDCDVVDFQEDSSITIDIPNELGCVRLWTGHSGYVFKLEIAVSTIRLKMVEVQ